MQINDSFDSITEKNIEELELSIGLKLPDDYKRFILRNNGGYPTPNKFMYTNHSGELLDSLVDHFLPIGSEFVNNVGLVYEYFVGEQRLPSGMLPIAYDPFGNMICMNLTEEHMGKVFFWDHELEHEDNNLSLVADGFTAFIERLEE